jgi:hypothetical protein
MEIHSDRIAGVKLFILSIISVLALGEPCIASTKYWDEYSTLERQDAMIRGSYEQEHRYFRRDCSGYIEAILSTLGHDIGGFINSYGIRTNGVTQIYEYVERSGSIYKDEPPKKGDLIFFSNTYDMNQDGKINDGLSHIGIVTNVDEDGTVSFRHVIRGEVETDYINLTKPTLHSYKGRIINSYLRRASKNSTYPALTSQLFDFFGSLNP